MVLLIPGSGYKINVVKVSGTSQSINFFGEKEQLAEVWDLDCVNRSYLNCKRAVQQLLLREPLKVAEKGRSTRNFSAGPTLLVFFVFACNLSFR
jgi:hypothetical protein